MAPIDRYTPPLIWVSSSFIILTSLLSSFLSADDKADLSISFISRSLSLRTLARSASFADILVSSIDLGSLASTLELKLREAMSKKVKKSSFFIMLKLIFGLKYSPCRIQILFLLSRILLHTYIYLLHYFT